MLNTRSFGTGINLGRTNDCENTTSNEEAQGSTPIVLQKAEETHHKENTA